MKPHFKRSKGYWESHYFRGPAIHLPIARHKTLAGCVENLRLYRPELLKETKHELA